uniref:Type I interferon 5 n=1 Tax=Xenopus laevis TaxID=8355 RepID=A0A1B1FFT5_XENLA|nr:interferon a3 [Xenopus laevis]ANQ43310.1 type I interferon 5 [Xenopus laevis]
MKIITGQGLNRTRRFTSSWENESYDVSTIIAVAQSYLHCPLPKLQMASPQTGISQHPNSPNLQPIEFDIVCHDYPTAQPNLERLYNITQVEAAALAVREVLNETIRFYRKHHESMGCKQQAWERFQQLLYYQIHQLEGCVPETGENDLLKNKISEQFQQWEKNVAEQAWS